MKPTLSWKTSSMILLIVGIVGIFTITACAKQQGPIGGQRDDKGCLTGAGYSWDADIGACTRAWEIKGDLAKAAKFVIAPMSVRPVTVVSVDALNCTGCFDVKLQIMDTQEIRSVRIANWTMCDTCPEYVPPAPGWCSDGTIVAREKSPCGCQDPPRCVKACTADAKLCPDGTAVGRDSENNCEFTPCPTEGNICTEEQKKAEICTMDYIPVCGWFNQSIQCFAYPCASTYSNKCEACSDEKVASWTEGECPKPG